MDLWELTARERIRDTLARYNWAGDALRLEEMAGAFCEDGRLEVRGQEPLLGRDAIVRFIRGVAGDKGTAEAVRPSIVRHLLTNVRFLEVTPEQARVDAYFTVLTDIGLDHHGRYRDVFVPVGEEWLIRHRFVSTDWRAPDSLMASPSSVHRPPRHDCKG